MKNNQINNKEFEKESEQLFEEAVLIQKSINWWEKQIDNITDELDKFHDKGKLTDKEEEKVCSLIDQLDLMVSRGEIEKKNMEKWVKKKDALKEKYGRKK